jgi:hypothetical protein
VPPDARIQTQKFESPADPARGVYVSASQQ